MVGGRDLSPGVKHAAVSGKIRLGPSTWQHGIVTPASKHPTPCFGASGDIKRAHDKI